MLINNFSDMLYACCLHYYILDYKSNNFRTCINQLAPNYLLSYRDEWAKFFPWCIIVLFTVSQCVNSNWIFGIDCVTDWFVVAVHEIQIFTKSFRKYPHSSSCLYLYIKWIPVMTGKEVCSSFWDADQWVLINQTFKVEYWLSDVPEGDSQYDSPIFFMSCHRIIQN